MGRNLRISCVCLRLRDILEEWLINLGFANEKEIRPQLKEKKRSDFLSVRVLLVYRGVKLIELE